MRKLVTAISVAAVAATPFVVKMLSFGGGYVAGHEIVQAINQSRQPTADDLYAKLIESAANSKTKLQLPKRIDDATTYADITAEYPLTMVLHYIIDDGVAITPPDWDDQDKSLRASYCDTKDRNGIGEFHMSYRFEYKQTGRVVHNYLLSTC
jgi:hypothetical protein